MSNTLVLPQELADHLLALARLPNETGGVLLARLATEPSGGKRLLGMEFHESSEHAYIHRGDSSLVVASGGYVPALARAEEIGAVALWVHTHPGEDASPEPSNKDRQVDQELATTFRIRNGSEFYGALIVSPSAGTIAFTGHIQTQNITYELDRIFVAGARFSLISSATTEAPPLEGLLDRNVRAFGGAVQQAIGDLRITIVGCGGTGSAVAEQLVRLGARNITLVDPDTLSESNVTRVYGSTLADVGRLKVEVLGDHLQRISEKTTIERVCGKVTNEATARRLVGADVVFGCTDDNAGRLRLSRFSSFYLAPVIDCGILLDSDGSGQIRGIDGRVTILHPGAACLVCRDRIDLNRAAAEDLAEAEHERLVKEGYAPALSGVEPAVVAFTTAVAAASVAELIERLVGYGPTTVPSEVLLRIHDREVSTNTKEPRPGHYCSPAAKLMGRGDTTPFLEIQWSS
jgi:molybdopterin/thiamine biosynthesis adenylyltransferase/proteasome lid subunit RPN8/RPN11